MYDELSQSIEKYEKIDEEGMAVIYRALSDDYKRRESWLCIIIDDESLIQIEEDFSDIITHSSAENSDEATASIKRLICHLEQIRRLSGFNIKSIL